MNGVRIHKTGAPEVLQSSDGRLTLSVPIQIKRRGGRRRSRCPMASLASPGHGTRPPRLCNWP